MSEGLAPTIERALGSAVTGQRAMHGGCIAEVLRVDLADGRTVVAKSGSGDLELEAAMLRVLAERSSLPVPGVLHTEPGLLVIEHVENDGRCDAGAERHAAELLADLHSVRGESFGFGFDTLIGPLAQPNPPTASWVEFFATSRLRHFGAAARERGAVSAACWDGLRRLADRLSDYLDEPGHPSLVHGDVWGGNVLCRRGRVAAFIDPAVHHAHPEVELAFTTLFSTLGGPFFERYHELRPIREGFFETRRDIYNLYPLLVHAVLFGGGYGASVEQTVRRFA